MTKGNPAKPKQETSSQRAARLEAEARLRLTPKRRMRGRRPKRVAFGLSLASFQIVKIKEIITHTALLIIVLTCESRFGESINLNCRAST